MKEKIKTNEGRQDGMRNKTRKKEEYRRRSDNGDSVRDRLSDRGVSEERILPNVSWQITPCSGRRETT